MPSGFDNFFDDNIFEVCIKNKFSNVNCIFGLVEFISSFALLIITIIGLVKMIKYYDSFNFEICLVIFSICQILLMDMIIITPHDFLFELFFVTQLFVISLIMRKFIIIIRHEKLKENVIFIIINVISLVIFIFFILSMFDLFLSKIYLYMRFSSRIFYFSITVCLAFLCRALIKKLDKYEKKSETFDLFLRKNTAKTSKSEHFIFSVYSQELFFLIRKKQITPLYIVNLICSFIQMMFILLATFALTEMFFKKDNKIVSTNTGYIIYYIYLLSYFLNIMVNFICFYWMIREQYNQPDMIMPQKKENKLLDEDYIIRESVLTSQELSNTLFLEENDKKTEKQKSLYNNSFSDADEKENQEIYFVKKDENSDKFDDNININRETNASNNAINNSNFINIK
jgi:hypothetical protein